MNKNPVNQKDILLKTLKIADYKGDKEAYVNKYLDLCYQETLLSLLESLPEEQQKEIQEELEEKKDSKGSRVIISIMKKYFTAEKLYETSAAISEKAFTEMVKNLQPVLSSEQKQELHDYLGTLVTE